MQPAALARRAFTLVEMVVVIAIAGIALAIVGPALILAPRAHGLETIIAGARRAALRRSEAVSLIVGPDGQWRMVAARSGATVLSGAGAGPAPLKIDVSPLGLCTIGGESDAGRMAIDPFTCALDDSASVSR